MLKPNIHLKQGVTSMQVIKINSKFAPTYNHFILLLAAIFLLLAYKPLSAASAFDAVIKNLHVEQNLIVNRSYTATMEVKNTGSQTWTADKAVTLGFTRATSASLRLPSRVLLNSSDQIKPGQSKEFKFKLTAPANTGIYQLQAVMQQSGDPFGAVSKKIDLVTETHVHRVKFISQLFPETMEAGQEYNIVVQFKNTGSATWDASRGYKLGLTAGGNVWDIRQIPLDKSAVVTTDQLATFQFQLKAPDKAGIYPIQWQMLRGKRWFGEKTPVQHISVKESGSSSGAEFVYQDIPALQSINQQPFAIFERGKIYSVALTFKNTSDESWADGRFSLNSQNPPNSLTWSVDRVDLKTNETVKPGAFKTFSFKVIAPLKPGIYNFQWQMVKGFSDWFGEKSENI